MGYRISLKERDIKVIVPIKRLNELFPKHKTDSYEWKLSKKGSLMIAALTEQGWIAIWAKFKTGDNVEIYAMNGSRSFYSRHGYYFIEEIIKLVQDYKGNLNLSTREPDTGGGSITIIYQGEMIHGVFNRKIGTPHAYTSVWKDTI